MSCERKMAAVYAVLISVNLIFSNIPFSRASTHWVVTEDGRVQAQMDSVFNMKRPYDLVAFMKQEDRAAMLDELKQELLSRKDEIDRTEDRDTGLEEKFYKTDEDCLAAGKQLPDLDLYISTVLPLENKGIRPEDFLPVFISGSTLMQPDCTMYTDMPYSPYAFEHLDGMKERRNLPGTAELGLKNAITYQDNVDEYGHRIFEAFKSNKTSWVLYNMAAFYWRIKGDPYNVIECVRRALHYSPRHQKDVALISLANVLHRAQKSNEAAIVVHAALDVSKELNVNHFTLGNIYAVLGEYNKSVICFENTLKIQPDFEAAAKRKHAVLCHAKLEGALEAQHRSLQRTLNDLKDYQRKHDFWQQQNDKLLSEQVPVDVKLAQHVAYEELRIREISSEIGEYCRMGDKDGKQVLMCSWGRKAEPVIKMDLTDNTSNDRTEEVKTKVVPVKSSLEDDSDKDFSKPVHGQKYSYETVKAPRAQGVTPEHLLVGWPEKAECDDLVQNKVPDPRNLTSTYLCPSNKGFEVKLLLTEALGLKEGDEHPLPWYPPVCVTLLDIPEGNTKSYDHVHSVSQEQRKTVPLKLVDSFHTELLLGHANNGKITIEELGQRILSGLKQNSGPKWILFNLAGLYWRIIGNNYHAIECFRRSIYTSPIEVQDVSEVNLANVLYRWGRYEDARVLVIEALRRNEYEPASNFLLGNIEWALKNYSGAVYRYELALEAEPEYTDVTNTLRALKCFLKFYQAQQSVAPNEVLSSCHSGVSNDMQSESRVVCRNENGEEKCVLETRTRKAGKQVSSPSSSSCGCQTCCNRCCGNGGNSCPQPKGPAGSDPALPNLSMVEHDSGDDSDTEVKDLRIQEVLDETCVSEECHNVKVQCLVPIQSQSNGQPPHIKLELVKGQMFQKFIFAESPDELTVRPEDCVIFNDGTKTEGCSRPEFKAYIEELAEMEEDDDSLSLYINGHLTKILPLGRGQEVGPGNDRLHIHMGKHKLGGVKFVTGGKKTKEWSMDRKAQKGKEGENSWKEQDGKEGINSRQDQDVKKVGNSRKAQDGKEGGNIQQDHGKEVGNSGNKKDGKEGDNSQKEKEEKEGGNSRQDQDGKKGKKGRKYQDGKEVKETSKVKEGKVISKDGKDFQASTGKADGVKGPERLEPPPFHAHVTVDSPPSQEVPDEDDRKRDVLQLPDSMVPDTQKYIRKRLHIAVPKTDECQKLPKVDLRKFTSTWLSLSVKNVRLSQFLNFEENIRKNDYMEPECRYDVPVMSVADHLPGVQYRDELDYKPEFGLKGVLEKISGRSESIEVIGTRIARGLAKNETSWVLVNLAALYWRVRGVANKALNCLRVAMYTSPIQTKDMALLSIANILHRSGYVNDAIVAASHAMDLSPNLVVGHFNMANLYAAKEQWDDAAMFYESTLGLQSDFEPAKLRLKLIHCMKVLKKRS
ncbi:tetratricopeptide repeat protein 17-like isoform X3 [Mya arenaria]|uniref:tetratricopeptide repeat protein 17-like isoform X3 n=1 Tax=Mya arenaria TaxID=6604 RepID=UPI0022E12412|nr:tetratricopeptide repeat protein 17-like isoform X3 [Mya arenaria]